MSVRTPAVSGSFYPAEPGKLAFQIESFIKRPTLGSDSQMPKILIVPHAGYQYSGETAAQAYALLEPYRARYQKVVLLGPSHRVPLNGIAAPQTDWFQTPLGNVPIDQASISKISSIELVTVRDDVHALEHSLEVQVPFLQTVLDDFSLIPLVVGNASAKLVCDVCKLLWGADETLFVVSTDLSHFLYYNDAQKVDAETIEKIITFNSDISGAEACGHNPLNGTLMCANSRNMVIAPLAHCNSGDITGERNSVVGYASFVLYETTALD